MWEDSYQANLAGFWLLGKNWARQAEDKPQPSNSCELICWLWSLSASHPQHPAKRGGHPFVMLQVRLQTVYRGPWASREGLSLFKALFL